MKSTLKLSLQKFFRSAKDAEDLIRKALEKGEILPKEQRFDSNCITPGITSIDLFDRNMSRPHYEFINF